jgi:hypothetical protein
MTNTSPVPTIADLWRRLRAWLAIALRRGPAAVARLVTRKAQDAVARRLRLIESLLLKLLLIEAATTRRPIPERCAAASPGLSPARHSSSGHAEIPTDPKTWRVRFRPRLRGLTPAQQLPRRSAPPRTRTPAIAARAHKLARRLEALRRVIANPRRAIAALARRLAALGAAAHALARAIALSRPRAVASIALAHAMIYAHDAVIHDSS